MATPHYQPITFTVSSGAICFGHLHDIERASSLPIQPPAENPTPNLGGTAASYGIEHNVAAQNGIWTAYPLLRKVGENPVAWFVAHEQIDPLPEIHKLLRVAGSPYEYECGHVTNCDATRAEGVLLLNRYDWDCDPSEVLDTDDTLFDAETIGVVDYESAVVQVRKWANNKLSADREPSKHGMWLHCPGAEYVWVRLGMNEDYTQARSLLVFNIFTVFFETYLPGQPQPLREYETPLKRFHRHLREGHDFSGVSALREKWDPAGDVGLCIPLQPPQHSELLGPYEKNCHILRIGELKALLADIPQEWGKGYRPQRGPDGSRRLVLRNEQPAVLAGDFEEDICELMNQIVLSYLEHFVVPLCSKTSANELGTALLSNTEGEVDKVRMGWFMDGVSSAVDPTIIGTRIRSFLQRSTDSARPFLLGHGSILCLARLIIAMVRQFFEFVDEYAVGRQTSEDMEPGERAIITPREVRIQIYLSGSPSAFRYSAFFWYGTDPTRPQFRRYDPNENRLRKLIQKLRASELEQHD